MTGRLGIGVVCKLMWSLPKQVWTIRQQPCRHNGPYEVLRTCVNWALVPFSQWCGAFQSNWRPSINDHLGSLNDARH